MLSDDITQGPIAVRDDPCAGAADAVAKLRKLGISSTMLTADNPRTAQAIGDGLAIEHRSDLMPDDKVTAIRDLTTDARMMMIGRGYARAEERLRPKRMHSGGAVPLRVPIWNESASGPFRFVASSGVSPAHHPARRDCPARRAHSGKTRTSAARHQKADTRLVPCETKPTSAGPRRMPA